MLSRIWNWTKKVAKAIYESESVRNAVKVLGGTIAGVLGTIGVEGCSFFGPGVGANIF